MGRFGIINCIVLINIKSLVKLPSFLQSTLENYTSQGFWPFHLCLQKLFITFSYYSFCACQLSNDIFSFIFDTGNLYFLLFFPSLVFLGSLSVFDLLILLIIFFLFHCFLPCNYFFPSTYFGFNLNFSFCDCVLPSPLF